ncbi:MAG: hypothetical protein H8D97_01615 [Proteobacteria bacterium]|nr:hypothetical protein [Pseudomonadota bacterium]
MDITKPKKGQFVVHKDSKTQKIDRLYLNGGVRVESGDFYQGYQLTPGKVGEWKANCGEQFQEGILNSSDGCCQRKKPSRK